ncbi:AAA family ATPase [Selenomonas sp. KH1T6]|uniref:AAA family ATPase n=1 Tax=Selenomonas sp. KH1T6 TaxID=3158784 RepID=UPI0008A72F55|nr:Predicted ATP-binding protein involved in virulence [Selenomonas ruminantium]
MNENFIKTLKIDKVRHLENITIPLSEEKCKHLILTGKNGSGKTSVLEALKAYLSIYTEDARMQELIKFWRDSINRSKNTDNKTITSINDITKQEEITGYKKELSRYEKGLVPEINNLNEMRVKIAEGKFIISYYGAERNYVIQNEKQISKVDIKTKYKISDRPGDVFVKYILNLKATEAMAEKNGKPERAAEISAWFQRFDKTLQKIFKDENAHLEFNFETYEFHIMIPHREAFSFAEMSSGYAAVLDIITDIMMRMEEKVKSSFDLPGIVMVDEIETHLHIELQKDILPILIELFPNIQFIVTTHSPFILSSIDNAVIYDLESKTLVNNDKGLSNITYEGVVEGYFNSSTLSRELVNKFNRYKQLVSKKQLSDDDYAEIIDLEAYLDEIPDFLAMEIMADYHKMKLELSNREATTNG